MIAVAVLAAFGPIAKNDFANWDDQNTLYQNPDLKPPSIAKLARYWQAPAIDLYIPVTYTYWSAVAIIAYDEATKTLSPMPFHVCSIVLHAIAAGLAFAVLRALRMPPLAAYFGTLLFALHPVQVESVAWTSGAKDVLAGAFSLLALWLYVRHAQCDNSSRRRLFALASVSFALAMLAKPSAMTLPVIAALIDAFILRRSIRKWGVPVAIWLALALPVAIAAKQFQPAAYVDAQPIWFRPVVAFDAVAFYLTHLFTPFELAPDYGRSPRAIWPATGTTIAAGGGLAIIVIAVFRTAHKTTTTLAALGIFVAATLPVLGLVRFDFQKYSTVADHYLYLAMLGPAIVLASLLSRYRSRALYAVVAVIVLVLGVRSALQTRHWRNSDTLFTHTIKVNPGSLAGHTVLAFLATQRGQPDAAAAHYVHALETHPNDPAANFNLANLLMNNGELVESLPFFKRAIANAQPGELARFHNNLGVAFAKLHEHEKAAAQFQRALAADPTFVDARMNLNRLPLATQRKSP